MRFAQMIAIIRYEVLWQRRQRLLIGVILSAIVLPLSMYALFGQGNSAEVQRAWIVSGGITTEAALTVTSRYAITYSAMTMYMITLIILPVISADVIARDRQHGVRELLDGLPLTTGTYLGGKLLGWWVSVSIGLAAAMVAVGAGLWILIGPYHVADYAVAWLTISRGVGLVNSALTMLLAAGQPTRRRAIMVGVVFAAVCLFANITLLTEPGLVWNVLSPGRQAITMHFFVGAWNDAILEQVATHEEVLWSLMGGVLEVAVVWVGAWWWIKTRNE